MWWAKLISTESSLNPPGMNLVWSLFYCMFLSLFYNSLFHFLFQQGPLFSPLHFSYVVSPHSLNLFKWCPSTLSSKWSSEYMHVLPAISYWGTGKMCKAFYTRAIWHVSLLPKQLSFNLSFHLHVTFLTIVPNISWFQSWTRTLGSIRQDIFQQT